MHKYQLIRSELSAHVSIQRKVWAPEFSNAAVTVLESQGGKWPSERAVVCVSEDAAKLVDHTTVFGDQVESKVQMKSSNVKMPTVSKVANAKCSCQLKMSKLTARVETPKWLQQLFQSPLWMISSVQGLPNSGLQLVTTNSLTLGLGPGLELVTTNSGTLGPGLQLDATNSATLGPDPGLQLVTTNSLTPGRPRVTTRRRLARERGDEVLKT